MKYKVVELQAELAYVQARLSILNRISEDPQFQQPQSTSMSPTMHLNDETAYMSMYFDHHPLQHDQCHPTPFELSNIGNPSYYSYHQELHDQELQDLPREL